MRSDRLLPLSLLSLIAGAVAVFGVACSEREEDPGSPANDAAAIPDVQTGLDAGLGDVTVPPVCTEGRRRCVGMDLELCDVGGWVLLQSCLAGEWCDVAVGICRVVDAGPDSAAPDAS